MNLKALIKAEDLHRDLMEIDARIAESHMILRDLSERDGQSLELHVKREQAKDPKGSDFNPEWLKSFMQEAQESSQYVSLYDRVQAIRFITDGLDHSYQIISRIKSIFSDFQQGICLSTIHKSKGLECSRVFNLCPEKLWHERSMQMQWTAEQENNLVYVAYTRAKNYLGFIRDYEY